MRAIGELLWENQIAPLLRHTGEVRLEGQVLTDEKWGHGIDQYITASRMECDGAWGSEVEILTLAHLLDTPVCSYNRAVIDYGDGEDCLCLIGIRWQKLHVIQGFWREINPSY